MTLPETFTMIRHGQSEANLIQDRVKSGTLKVLPPGLRERHDAHMRLTDLGIEQAAAAGLWLRTNGFAFDRFYVSPHTRTCETAVHLSLDEGYEVHWRVEDRFRERDWGEIHYVDPDTMGDPLDDASRHNRELSQWYWQPRAGESLSTGVRSRVESIMNSLYRRDQTKHVLAVTHGEWMRTAQFVIERMTPDFWEQMDSDPAYKMRNTMVLQYSRRVNGDPEGELSDHYGWRRAICPWDESLSWDGGRWVPVAFRMFSTAELRERIEQYKPLFGQVALEAERVPVNQPRPTLLTRLLAHLRALVKR